MTIACFVCCKHKTIACFVCCKHIGIACSMCCKHIRIACFVCCKHIRVAFFVYYQHARITGICCASRFSLAREGGGGRGEEGGQPHASKLARWSKKTATWNLRRSLLLHGPSAAPRRAARPSMAPSCCAAAGQGKGVGPARAGPGKEYIIIHQVHRILPYKAY